MSTEKQSTEKPSQSTMNAQSLMDPYLRAAKAWGEEMEKLQRMAIDAFTHALDEGYKVTREGATHLAAMQTQMRGQWEAQLQRASQMFSSFMS